MGGRESSCLESHDLPVQHSDSAGVAKPAFGNHHSKNASGKSYQWMLSLEQTVGEQDTYMVFECLPQVGNKIVRIQ